VTTSQIRQVLSEHIGKVLTPDLACDIELAATSPQESPINPVSFGETEHDGYEIRAERMADILPELHPLHEAHWQETEGYRHGFSLNPDYLRYQAIERAGGLIQFTARKDGELVGNLRLFMSESLHTQTSLVTEDTIFLKPEHRGGFLAMAMLRFGEDAVRSLGAQEIRSNSKLVNRADVLMRRMKYEPFAIQFAKFFKESEK